MTCVRPARTCLLIGRRAPRFTRKSRRIRACHCETRILNWPLAGKPMIELIQFPWSPYCLVQRRILEFGGVAHKIINVPQGDRSLVWRLTRQRYYQVPILKDGRTVLFETDENSQVIAKYLHAKLKLGLFPDELDGLQLIAC